MKLKENIETTVTTQNGNNPILKTQIQFAFLLQRHRRMVILTYCMYMYGVINKSASRSATNKFSKSMLKDERFTLLDVNK